MPTPVQSIRDIVTAQPSAAAILERFEINLCKQGENSLREVCSELQLSVEQVLEKLTAAENAANGSRELDPAVAPLAQLIQHIVRSHHVYVRQELPRLEHLAHKIATKHGDRAPEFKRIAAVISELRQDMSSHFEKEEQVLFPYIAQMDQEPLIAFVPPQACFHSVAQPVFMMVQDHETVSRLTAELEQLTHGFTPADWACTNHIGFIGALREFRDNLARHVELENDFLFPRAIELEAKLASGAAHGEYCTH